MAEKGFKKSGMDGESGTNRLKRDLMFFWGLHSNGRFDEPTICYALDRDVAAVGKELQALLNAGIVEKEVDQGVALYFLTANEGKRRPIVEWASPGHSGR